MKKLIRAGLFSSSLFLLALCCAPAVFAAAPESALDITKLLFVSDVAGLSQYTPKPEARFAIGDVCAIYVETTGFAMEPVQPGSEDEFNIDLALDLEITMPQRRRTIASEKDFDSLKTTVRSKLPATFMAFSFIFDEDRNPGEYVITLTLRDNLSEQSVTRQMTYQLEKPTEADRARQAEEQSQAK